MGGRDGKNAKGTFIWAVMHQNLSLGFPTKRDSNLSSQLQRIARQLKFLS